MFAQSELLNHLDEIARLMELAGENPFKSRAFRRGHATLSQSEDWAERAKKGTLTELPGIGAGIAQVVTEFLKTGTSTEREALLKKIPEGLVELTQVPGLGPKKARHLVEELGIHSISELEYACRENRLTSLKSFGEKLQAKILEEIKKIRDRAGKLRLSDALMLGDEILQMLTKKFPKIKMEWTGQLARKLEIIDQLDLLVMSKKSEIEKWITDQKFPIQIKIHESLLDQWEEAQIKLGSSREFLKALGSKKTALSPEMREFSDAIALSQSGALKDVATLESIRGIFHNHTSYSDGLASIEEMVKEAKRLGLKYIGLSDHSQSAFYAHGLSEVDLKAQKKEIDQVQKKYPDIKIFWGVESDILQDGALDYPDKILRQFDFVVASVHSRFKMDQKTMTDRIVRAIQNPYTTMIGHLTGRLLLGRDGYDLDFEKIFKEAAKHNVAIELNSNPHRLDVDWRHGPLLRHYGVKVAINPDAHDVEGISDFRYGVWMARKALLPKKEVLNTWDASEVESWLQKRKKL